jgi:hypothetical protein
VNADVLRELSRRRTPVDRLRARATAAAAAGMGVALLAAASIAGLRADQPTGTTLAYRDATGAEVTEVLVEIGGGLAPFLAQDGLRPGTVLAAVLLVLPFAALALQALRVGSLALDQQAARLSLAGATPADLRRIRVRRAGLAFGAGGLLAGPLHVLLWLALGPAVTPGWRLLPVPQPWLVLVWAAVVVGLALVGAALAWRSGRRRPDPLSRQPTAAPPPGRPVAWTSGLAALLVLVVGFRLQGGDAGFAVALLVAVLLLLVSVHAVVTRRAGATRATRPAGGPRAPSADRLPRAGSRLRLARRDAAVVVLAAAQRRADPRACGAVAGVLFVCGLSFGVVASFAVGVLVPPDDGFGVGRDVAFYVGGAGLAAVVGIVAAVVALLALALTLTDHLLTARRSVAATAALGADVRRLRAVQDRALTATAVPATVVGTLLAGAAYTVVGVGFSAERLLAGLAAVAVAAVLAALLVGGACRLVSAALTARLRSATALEHLRTP